MIKPKDHDIFGTADIKFAPRITNNSYVDPNAAFKKKMNENYENYSSKLQNGSHPITHQLTQQTKVNEFAHFEEKYHKDRKEKDLQSSIFYPPTVNKNLHTVQQHQNSKNPQAKEHNFGRKNVMQRQVLQFQENNSHFKGNSSRLFDLDQRVSQTNLHQKGIPLIPHKMQWNDHDSIRYSYINPSKEEKHSNVISHLQVDLSQSKSTIFQSKQTIAESGKNKVNETEKSTKNINRQNNKNLQNKEILITNQLKNQAPLLKEDSVEIRVMKGWDNALLQSLTKQCKFNSTAILKFEIQTDSKAVIYLKRSKRWQNVADWLRKQGKMKIKVVNQ